MCVCAAVEEVGSIVGADCGYVESFYLKIKKSVEFFALLRFERKVKNRID